MRIKGKALASAPLFLLLSCRTELAPVLVTEEDPVSAPAPPTATPTPAPAPIAVAPPTAGTWVPTGTLGGEAVIPSNFDPLSELVNAALPPSAAPDPVGAFRFICNAGQLLYDDPILFPGQSGKSHLHQFYGNTAANAQSTFRSLRTTGDSTCMSPLNRSAYWMPAMLDGRGNVVRPDYVSIYYKRRPISDSHCSLSSGNPQAEGNCVPLPHGLKFIFGYDPTGKNNARTGSTHFDCQGPTARPGAYPNLTEALKNCPAGNQLGAVIQAPTCWDGKNLDSPDHRSHVAYFQLINSKLKCPTTHPYLIPGFTMGAWYTVAQGDVTLKTVNGVVRSNWELSSDHMEPGQQPGFTFHADFWMAWDSTIAQMWENHCLNQHLSCAAGNLGNGKMLKQFAGFSWTANPRLVPVP